MFRTAGAGLLLAPFWDHAKLLLIEIRRLSELLRALKSDDKSTPTSNMKRTPSWPLVAFCISRIAVPLALAPFSRSLSLYPEKTKPDHQQETGV